MDAGRINVRRKIAHIHSSLHRNIYFLHTEFLLFQPVSFKILLVRFSYKEESIMTQYLTDVTSVSTKGQVVLPKSIRDSLTLQSGTKLLVVSDGQSIILKPIEMPDISEFQGLMEAAASWADEVGMTEEDISSAITAVRDRKRVKP
jgi:antitoxin PrlF